MQNPEAATIRDERGCQRLIQPGQTDSRTGLLKAVHDKLAAAAGEPPDPIDDPALWSRALREDADPFAILRAALDLDEQKPRRAVPVPDVAGQRPDRLLSVVGKKGALLSVGGVLVLAGEGGIAKSPLALSIALAMAARMDNIYGDLHGGLFKGIGGPTLVASYEDWPAVSADRLRKLAALWWPDTETDIGATALKRVHVLDLAGRPLFGPVASDSEIVLYNARPDRMPGWDDLWGEVERVGARMVVTDPALSAYVSDANNAAPVREFMGALAARALSLQCGVVLVAHSRKDSRGGNRSDPFDPGNVAGSTHWTDAARGALTLTWENDSDVGSRVLAVSKANYGPARILTAVDPVRSPHGEIVGFTGGPWQTLAERKATIKTETAAERKANGGGKAKTSAAAKRNPY